jgi:hypothetical protein
LTYNPASSSLDDFLGIVGLQIYPALKANNLKEDKMELLTEELRRSLPALYSQEGNPDPVVHIKFFTPDSNWPWYVTEGSAEEDGFIFFGYVIGFEREWG